MGSQADVGGMLTGKDGKLYTILNTGARMPLVQFGTYAGESAKSQLEAAIEEAVRVGYRAFDTAECYGTEPEVGRALNKVMEEGLVSRDDLFVTTKLWNDHHAAKDVEPTLRASLARLGLEYVDLYLIHWPITCNKGPTVQPPLEETWKAMEVIYKKGLARAIGVSNYSIKKTEDLLAYGSVVPAVNQVECHPTWRSDDLVNFNNSKGIHTSAWGPLGSQMPVAKPTERAEVREAAQKLGRTPAQVVLRWGLQHGVSVLPKTGTLSRLKENLDVMDWELPEEDFQALSKLEPQKRQFALEGDPDCEGWFHAEGPYTCEKDLWDE